LFGFQGRMGQSKEAEESITKAIAAGYHDLALIKKGTDLNALRGRDDFKKLVADVEAKVPKSK
jgi:hypothetical protein